MTADSSMVSLEEIAETISQDQGLTTKILALANSAFYGLQAKVSSVSRAIALLGLKEIRNLVLILGAQSVTVRHNLPTHFDLEDYWEHQLSVGVLAKTIAAKHKSVDADILFTAGLLHDFGKILTAMHRPEDWEAIQLITQDKLMAYNHAEELHWGLEHGLIGAMTLNSWNLPPELTEPVNWHHSPDLSEDFCLEAQIICLADAMHHHILRPEAPLPDEAYDILDDMGLDFDELAQELQTTLEEEDLAQFVAALR